MVSLIDKSSMEKLASIYYSSIQPLHFSFFKGGGGCDERGGGKLMRFLHLVDLVCVCVFV